MLCPESWCLIEELLLEEKKKLAVRRRANLKVQFVICVGDMTTKKKKSPEGISMTHDITGLLAAQVTDYFLIIAHPLSVLWRVFFPPTLKRVQLKLKSSCLSALQLSGDLNSKLNILIMNTATAMQKPR